MKAEAEKDLGLQPGASHHEPQRRRENGIASGYEITRIERADTERKKDGWLALPPAIPLRIMLMTTNNRVVSYEVRGIDQCMNPTETYRISDEFKLLHEGEVLDKEEQDWEITVNTTSPSDEKPDNEDETDTPCRNHQRRRHDD